MNHKELCYKSVAELGKLIRTGDLSPVELVQAYLLRIAEVKTVLNSWITLLPERALKEAQKAEDDIIKGRYRGPLHGIPFGLKDVYKTKGIRTTYGCSAYDDYKPIEDAATVVQLHRAGAILLGKQNMHTLALGPTGQNEYYGDMHNPWDPTRYTGGSSGGSASAVSAGECAFAMGSDSGGSIRMPAGLCGVVGLKPTFGLLTTDGLMQISSSMDHHGPMTRTVEDSALVLQVLTKNTPENPHTRGKRLSISLKRVKRNIKGIRIGVPKEFFEVPVDAEVHQAIRRALNVFRELGAVLKEVSWPLFQYASTISSAILAVDAADSLKPLILKRASQIDPLVRNRIASGFFIPAIRYLQAQKARTKLNQQGYELFRQIDLIAGPTLGVAAPKIGAKEVTISGSKIGVFKALPSFVRAFNLNGCPAISVPCGFTSQKLPIGLQLAGAPFAEEAVLQAAYAYEKANPLYDQHPPI